MWRVMSLIAWISLLLVVLTLLAYALKGLPFAALCPLIIVWSYIGLKQIMAHLPTFQKQRNSSPDRTIRESA